MPPRARLATNRVALPNRRFHADRIAVSPLGKCVPRSLRGGGACRKSLRRGCRRSSQQHCGWPFPLDRCEGETRWVLPRVSVVPVMPVVRPGVCRKVRFARNIPIGQTGESLTPLAEPISASKARDVKWWHGVIARAVRDGADFCWQG